MAEEIKNEEVTPSEPSTEDVQTPSETAPELTLPELSDDQIQKVISDHKHKVKVDGVESELAYDDLVRDYQMRQSSDKRFREGDEAKTKYEGMMSNLDNLAQTDEGKKKIAEVFGIPWQDKVIQQETEPVEFDTPEQEEIASLKNEISELKSEFKGLGDQYNSDKNSAEKDKISQEFNAATEKFPIMQKKELRDFAIQLMLRDSKLTTEQACEHVNSLIKGEATNMTNNYIEDKKKTAKDQIVAAGGAIASGAKNPRDFKSVGERAAAMLENLKAGR